jgi:hypothetical protein
LNDRAIGNGPRRRRSWYRRKLRQRRMATAAIVVMAIAVVCALNVVRILSSPPSGRAPHGTSELQAARTYLNQQLGLVSPRAGKHRSYVPRIPGVYPYSVVPGGVKDADALRTVAAHDSAVARHYSNFNFAKAHIERISAPREVYVSYRIRDSIFWTQKKILLPAGELLLTDGAITARAKCGNQISEVAKPDISDQEPEQDVMDQPVAALEPPTVPFPMRPQVALPELAAGQPIPDSYGGGFNFPYAPILAGPPIGLCLNKNGTVEKNCGSHHKPPVIPEPRTFVLLATGLTMILWRYRAGRVTA